jgi:hypothetical protein
MHFAHRLAICAAVLTATILALSPCPAAEPAAELLVRIANTPLEITPSAGGGVNIGVGASKALSECRPYLASRAPGTQTWTEELSTYQVISETTEQLVLEATFANAVATVTLKRDSTGRYVLTGLLKSTSQQPIELARFHYLDGRVMDPSLNLLSMRQFELPGRIVKPTEQLPSPRAACQKGWGGVHWPRLTDPIHDRANTAISGDTGMLAADWNSPGFFLGFTGPGSAFGELGIRTAEKYTSFFAGVLLDAVRLEPGTSRVLENAVLSFGDPQEELRNWAITCRDLLGPARMRPPLVGFCSWYQKGQGVQPSDIRRAIDSFASYEAPPGGRTIQIDDGYQVSPGDWSGRGEWKSELLKIRQEISAKGFIPGIWVAPTAIHATHPIVRNHPNWLQRDATGAPCIRFHNWRSFNGSSKAETYFLEPDHPAARKFITDALRQLHADGWSYFKIDFAYTVSTDRVKYDPHKTTYESLRDQWRLFREALGEDAIINSCNGGIWRYTLGTVDISRIGGDIGSKMSSLRRNLSEMMLRSHLNGLWYQVDPDVFYMRNEHTQLDFEESHLLTSTQGLLGTAFITSDFADQWGPPSVAVVRRYWNKQGPRVPAMLHLVLRPDGLPAAVAVAYGNGEYAVGLYNWNNTIADVAISLTDLRLPEDIKFQESSRIAERTTLTDSILTISDQPAESMRVINLQTHPAP